MEGQSQGDRKGRMLLFLVALVMFGCGTAVNPLASGGPDTPSSGLPGQPDGAPPRNRVQGQVSDKGGASLPGVLVTPRSTDAPPQAVPEIAITTDEDGRYQWVLPPGNYELTFTQNGYAPATVAVTVMADRPVTVDIILQHR
ncbi:MAG: carboxypeptidase-like regulatory domain-containing protein [Chloroflexales bacterium]|nr:carboxypeptidase-like regulatory domain-containing protein [Chloroflexales bacterium]